MEPNAAADEKPRDEKPRDEKPRDEKPKVCWRIILSACVTLPLYVTLVPPASASCDPKARGFVKLDRYEIDGAKVHDKVKRLTWQRCSLGQTWNGEACADGVANVGWDDAMVKRDAGWRMPTKDELLTLVSAACHGPALNDVAFPGMESDNLLYWSSTAEADGVWIVNFTDGSLRKYKGQLQQYAVRLVRSGK